MNERADIPQYRGVSLITGRDRMDYLVAVERIHAEARFLVLQATDRASAVDENRDYTKDLRRGRAYIIGGFVRLCVLMRRKTMGNEGRRIALAILELARQAVDLLLPEQPTSPEPTAFSPRPVGLGRQIPRPSPARNVTVRSA
jgi:hypothetical protein